MARVNTRIARSRITTSHVVIESMYKAGQDRASAIHVHTLTRQVSSDTRAHKKRKLAHTPSQNRGLKEAVNMRELATRHQRGWEDTVNRSEGTLPLLIIGKTKPAPRKGERGRQASDKSRHSIKRRVLYSTGQGRAIHRLKRVAIRRGRERYTAAVGQAHLVDVIKEMPNAQQGKSELHRVELTGGVRAVMRLRNLNVVPNGSTILHIETDHTNSFDSYRTGHGINRDPRGRISDTHKSRLAPSDVPKRHRVNKHSHTLTRHRRGRRTHTTNARSSTAPRQVAPQGPQPHTRITEMASPPSTS